MGNIPVIHETGTAFMSLGDAITKHPEKARERWNNYAKESVIGSFVAAVAEKTNGNDEKAAEYFKGMGRATGKAVLLGGFLRDVPVFHELAVCGESLGDVIGGGDTESARGRWGKYVENSVIGGGICAIKAKSDGDDERAKKLALGCGKAGLRFGVTAVGVGVTVATGGLAAPYGIAASAATGAAVGEASGAGACAIGQVIDKGKVEDVGAVVGSGLFGCVVGAIAEAKAAKNAAKAKSSEAELFSYDSKKLKRPRNSFSFDGGKARRYSKQKDIWKPEDPGNMLDHKAANEAARQDIQSKVGNLNYRERPSKICVTQDTKTGDAFGSASVRGDQRSKFHQTMDSKQSKMLDSIPKKSRGVGHGNCAEQVGVNNRRYYQQQPENLFPNGREVTVQAFAQASKGSKGIYTIPIKPCASCAAVLKQFNKLDVSRKLRMDNHVMVEMIDAGLIVGCRHCNDQDCKECQD